ncbi:MAG: DUF2272 domain-containing protein [Candidatus Brocadia sp.]|nr:MAG: DUF2272 domain-containing protein [Candidatus Brocadia sp.]
MRSKGEAGSGLSRELIELAEKAIAVDKVSVSSNALLSQVLSKAGRAETQNSLGTEGFPSPASIFDAFAPGGAPVLRQYFERFFEVVAEPGVRPDDVFQLGDFLVRKAMCEGFGHVAIIAAPESWDYEQLSSAGLIPESHHLGAYVHVVEGGARPHALADSFARLILDETGRMPHDQMILRFRPGIMRWREDIPDLFEDVADTTVAVPDFDPSKRADIIHPILDPKQNTDAVRWNRKTHPGQSGVDPNDIRTELGRYVDLSKVKDEIDNHNKANLKNQIEVGTPPIDGVFVETVHQFQAKCFVETNQIDGKAGESTLDSLGLVNRKGLHEADKPNLTAQDWLNGLGEKISIATGGEFTARNWFRNMVNPAFLGQRFESAGELTGIHLVLARKLRIAERHLLSMPAYAGLTPVELGKVLGIDERHKGMRYKKGSKGNHTFGLALDISYTGNPYVAGDKDRPIGNKSFIKIMKSVTLLISGTEIDFTPTYLHSLATEPDPLTGRMRSTGEIYDALAQRDREFRAYLQLATDIEAIKKKLQERLDKGTANVFVSDKEKGDLEAASGRWQKQIQGHLKLLKTYFGSRRNPLHGFLNLNRDLVVALRDQACLAWGAIDLGPRRSGDIMHFDCRMDGAGKILNRGYAPQTGHPCLSVAGRAPEIFAEDVSSAPLLLDSETTPPGQTLYVKIDLKIVDKKNNEIAPPCTGIFIPQNYKPQSTVDLILYLHGYKGTFPGNDKSIKEYWDGKKFPFFAFREGLNDSGKNCILVAPTLGPKSETGILTNPGEIDKYLGQVMEALKAYGPYMARKQDPMAGSIILACHSGGGSPMLKLAKLKGGGYADKIVQCWCFDSLYANKLDDPEPEKERKQKWLANEWANWADSHQDAWLFVYYYDDRPKATSEKLKKKKFKHNNVCVVPSTAPERKKREKSKADPHFWVPIAHWLDRINNAPCNAAKASKESESLTSVPPTARTAVEDTVGDTKTFPSGESLTIVSGQDGPGEEYYDPNTSGNPLLDTSGNHRTKKLSRDFTVHELARSGPKKFDKARIDPELVNCLQAIQDYVGKSVIINSGYRSYTYNLYLYKKLGKEPKKRSQHLSGRAADIKIPGMTGVEIAKAAIDACGCRVAIGLAPNFAHVDVRGEFHVWNYGRVSEEQIEELRLYHREKCGKPSESGILQEQPGITSKCGFHGPSGAFVKEADLRAAVATAALDERKIWWMGAGSTAQKEDNDSRFGDLVRYWLAGHTGTIRPGKLEAVQKAALDPSVTYGNLGNATLNAAVLAFRRAAADVDARTADVYKKSDDVDSAIVRVNDAETKAKVTKTAVELAAKNMETANDRMKAASGRSDSGAQTAFDAASAALSAARMAYDTALKARDAEKNSLEVARRVLEAAKDKHKQARRLRKSLENPAKNWEDSDKQKVRKKILTKAGSTDPQNIDTLAEEALQLAHQSRADIEAWSAVFVVSCVRTAAIGHKLEAIDSRGAHGGLDGLLKASRRHSDYVVEARERRRKAVDGTYHAFEPIERAIKIGDIIITDRTDFIEKPARLRDVKKGDLLHGDIVTLVKAENGKTVYAEAIGGNVGHTVRRRRYPLNDTGRLIVLATELFAKEDDKGVFGSLAPLTETPMMLPVESTGRILALLSLVEKCI